MFQSRFPDHLFKSLKSDVLNQTIGTFRSVNDICTSPRSNYNKRKSIFDSCEESLSKKRRHNEEKFITLDIRTDRAAALTPTKTTSFIFNFNCKSCSKKFTKLGQYKSHINNDHKVSVLGIERKELKTSNKILEDSDIFGGKNGDHCSKCNQYTIQGNYRKPFSPKLHRSLLVEMNVDLLQTIGYKVVDAKKVPPVKPRNALKLVGEEFVVGELKGEGGFAKVFSATLNTKDGEFEDVVLKVQKPANDWEWYLLKEVHARLNVLDHPDLGAGKEWSRSFMSASRCLTYQDGSIIVSKLNKFGTVLDMINATNSADKTIVEPLAVLVTIELLGLVEILHSLNIIHGDLKPDNLMLTDFPSDVSRFIQLIDFGKAIDLQCFPSNALFDEFVKTSGLITVEMKEKRPYRHHIDYFGIAAVGYCLLFGQYIQIKKVNERWELKNSLKRWWKIDLWKSFFDTFLNLDKFDRDCLPSLTSWRQKFMNVFERENMEVGVEKACSILRRKTAAMKRRRTL